MLPPSELLGSQYEAYTSYLGERKACCTCPNFIHRNSEVHLGAAAPRAADSRTLHVGHATLVGRSQFVLVQVPPPLGSIAKTCHCV